MRFEREERVGDFDKKNRKKNAKLPQPKKKKQKKKKRRQKKVRKKKKKESQ